MTPPQPLTADLLLEHSGFLHGLARSLVLDEQRAEDVVQETFVAVLAKPPPPQVRLRAWLSTVTRNLALRSRRTEGRVRRREIQGARPETTVATADIAARVEIQRRIAEAVAALDEPGRSAIVWRYFDGLPPREIARSEGVSVRTIESRLRRAREVLRARLDADHGGSRVAWCAVLAPGLGLDISSLASSSAAGATAASTATTTAGAGLAATAAVGATLVSTKLIITAAAVCVTGAFFVGRQFPPTPPVSLEEGPAVPVVTDAPALRVDATRVAERVKGELSAATAANEELQAANTKLRADLEAARSQAALASSGGHATPSTEGAYQPAKYKSVIATMSWPKAGEAAAKMVPLLADLAAGFVDGKSPSQDVGIQVFHHNQELQKIAVAAIAAKVPGAGGNGAFTHPSVTINLIHAALEQAKLPLGKAQLEGLRSIGDRFIEDDVRRGAGYTDETFRLQKTIDECALKDRMFASIDALLTEAQRDVLHPESIRDRMGIDIFSSGTIWYAVSKAVDFTTREDLAASLVDRYKAKTKLSDDQVEILTVAARDWAQSFSAEFVKASMDTLGRTSQREAANGMLAGWQRVAQAREAAVHQMALNRALRDALGSKADAIRRDNSVFIPLKRPE